MMDAVSLIVAALAAGALAGAQGTATQAVQDAYQKTKELARRRFADNPAGEVALDKHEHQPDAWKGALAATLTESDAEADTELIAQAQSLMALLDPPGAREGKFRVIITDSEKFQIGDHNTMIN